VPETHSEVLECSARLATVRQLNSLTGAAAGDLPVSPCSAPVPVVLTAREVFRVRREKTRKCSAKAGGSGASASASPWHPPFNRE
jgi:hypothetical protein